MVFIACPCHIHPVFWTSQDKTGTCGSSTDTAIIIGAFEFFY